MEQRLILPINDCKLTASMKTAAYNNRFGFEHYGVDLVSAHKIRTLYASGIGTVLFAGYDNIVGNIVAVLYYNAHNHAYNRYGDVVFRYFHLKEIKVSQNQKVNQDTVLGVYGNTGHYDMSPHLHLEADEDTAHPLYTPTVRSSKLLKGSSCGATDKTMTNPLEWLYCKQSPPDSQSYETERGEFIKNGDKQIPVID